MSDPNPYARIARVVHLLCLPATTVKGSLHDLYARVFAPPEVHGVRVCPNCEDKLRSGAEVREAHSLRHTSS